MLTWKGYCKDLGRRNTKARCSTDSVHLSSSLGWAEHPRDDGARAWGSWSPSKSCLCRIYGMEWGSGWGWGTTGTQTESEAGTTVFSEQVSVDSHGVLPSQLHPEVSTQILKGTVRGVAGRWLNFLLPFLSLMPSFWKPVWDSVEAQVETNKCHRIRIPG